MAAEDRTPFTNLRAVLKVPCTVHVIPGPGADRVSYTSVITDFDEASFYLTRPSKGREEMPLGEGDELRIVYYAEDAVYDFSATVTGYHAGPGGARRYEATIPETCWRVQRRDSYRLPVRIEAEYRPVEPAPDDGGRAASRRDPIPALITDISGDGIALLVAEPIEVDSVIEVSFALDPDAPDRIREPVRVVRVWPAPRRADPAYSHACGGSFLEVGQHTRNRILRFVFRKQMEKLSGRRG